VAGRIMSPAASAKRNVTGYLKIRWTTSDSRPKLIIATAVRSNAASANSTLPPAGVNWIAFDDRLSTICRAAFDRH
jgi:hypothetical protein